MDDFLEWLFAGIVRYLPLILLVVGILVGVAISGCASVEPVPFVDLELAYGQESGAFMNYGRKADERGCRGNLAAGIEFKDTEWYIPTEVGFRHTSQCKRYPEVNLDMFFIKKRIGGH